MDQEQEKYDKVMNVLRKSKPDAGDTEQFSEKVLSRIQKESTSVSLQELIYEFIFGWVYIGWMRRSMVTAAIFTILFFGYEQAVILKRMNDFSGQFIIHSGSVRTTLPVDFSDKLRFVRLYGRKAAEGRLTFSEKDIDTFIESVNDTKKQYKDVLDIINSDPQLKSYFEDKMNKTEQVKPKI